MRITIFLAALMLGISAANAGQTADNSFSFRVQEDAVGSCSADRLDGGPTFRVDCDQAGRSWTVDATERMLVAPTTSDLALCNGAGFGRTPCWSEVSEEAKRTPYEWRASGSVIVDGVELQVYRACIKARDIDGDVVSRAAVAIRMGDWQRLPVNTNLAIEPQLAYGIESRGVAAHAEEYAACTMA